MCASIFVGERTSDGERSLVGGGTVRFLAGVGWGGRFHLESLTIYKLSSRKCTTQNYFY